MDQEIKPNNSTGLIIAGYLFPILSLAVFPILFCLVGVVIGIINIARNKSGHGITQIILSSIFGFIGVLIGFRMGVGLSPF